MYHTLYSVFEARVKYEPDKTALIECEKSLTYIQLYERVNRLADSMHKRGIRKGSKLAVLITNCMEYVELILVCHKLGITAVLCNYNLSPREIADQLKISGADAVVLPEDFKRFGIPVGDIGIDSQRCILLGDGDSEYCGWNQLLKQGNPEYIYVEPVNPEDDAVYIFTGGTTGEPKAAIHTYQSLLMNTFLHHYGVNPYFSTDVFLNYAPLYHWGGFSILLNILSVGATFIILKRFDAEAIYKRIAVDKATHIFLLPLTLVSDLKNIPYFKASDMESVRCVNLGGTPGTPDLIAGLFELFPHSDVNVGYGMTENACSIVQRITRETLEKRPELLKSVGKPAFESRVKLIGSDGKEVARGEVGEIYASSIGQFKGYLNKENPFVNGFFPTGDLFRQDEEGNFYFVERSKDMIRSGGENIYSIEVERVVEEHEAVEMCAVVALPNSRYEESVAAAVVFREGLYVSADELISFCREHLAHYKRPRNILVYAKDLPRTVLGKVDKKQIRRDFINE